MTAEIKNALQEKKNTNPSLVLLVVLILAVVLTWIIDSGEYQRSDKKIIAGTYHVINKNRTPENILGLSSGEPDTQSASPAGIIQALRSIPEGIIKQSGLIIMVLFIGGMFGILNQTGAIMKGLEKVLYITKGRIIVLVPALMLCFSAGSTFLGLAKEYLLLVPLVVGLLARIGLPAIYGLGIVAISVKLGYMSSVTNPYALTIAQPLAGVPLFSGMPLRIGGYIIFLITGVLFMIMAIRRHGCLPYQRETGGETTLTGRQRMLLLLLISGVAAMVFGAQKWHWKNNDIAAWYLFMSIVISAFSGMSANACADAFVEGMKKTLIAALLIGLATAVEIVLTKAQVLDTIIFNLSNLVSNHGPLVSAYSMFTTQLILDFAIPSTSGQAAVTMPVMAPLGQLSGVSAQSTVLAFLLGHGLTNLITPTSSGLLVLLAAAQVGWAQWAKFILPLFFIYALMAIGMLSFAIYTGY
ncbi:YfcC family protein [Pantoea sp. EABMAA-21]|uniref:YfcC family protein n=1 Tax=Enterobacterales TaxID=91347 RepID=UPI0024B5EFFB|nr:MULTISPECIES: YfcC family protein [Enterobacterales]MDI9223623.1 YfcC family protein [Pantoea sp. EA-12]MDI9265904.1 YfcC family protein [Serratia sp. PF2-63]MDI9267128.1 YfcC family protein [Serratia sp. PF-27]MDI9280135.1 YfcC family protein [Pantoea sp. EABMAA-21]